jgi:YegS/Rv2252/BmrU family lipid kinase
VIVNPASGQPQPVLHTINNVFRPAGIDWDVFITKRNGDARRLASEAVDSGADIVAVYGGDGTVMGVASGLIGCDVPLAILPGGTANVMSVELGIPGDLTEACQVICSKHTTVRGVDVGQVGERHFLLRASTGMEAERVKGADRELKDRFGSLAYAISALQQDWRKTYAFRLTLDGKRVDTEGLTCIIANSGSIGRPGLSLIPTISVSDGLLDVIVVRDGDLSSLLSIAANVIKQSEASEVIQHWQVKEVIVETDQPQTVQADGEIWNDTPIHATVLPHAAHILVPEK